MAFAGEDGCHVKSLSLHYWTTTQKQRGGEIISATSLCDKRAGAEKVDSTVTGTHCDHC